jgi:hypothetical protein
LGLGVGLSAGWGTLTEYPTAIPAVILTVFAVALVWAGGPARRARVGSAVLAGGAVCLLVLMLYNEDAFGHAIGLSYMNKAGFAGMQAGVMGVTYPHAGALWELTFGRYRGLFYLAPVLIAGAVGLFFLPDGAAPRTATLIVLYYFLFNSAYYYWDAGWTYGPRLMSPVLPFLCWPLAALWTRFGSSVRAALVALALWSGAVTLMAEATTVQPPQYLHDPVAELFWPDFQQGDLSINGQSFLNRRIGTLPGEPPIAHAWNVGQEMGLQGLESLAPLLAAWAAIAAVWMFDRRRREAARSVQPAFPAP